MTALNSYHSIALTAWQDSADGIHQYRTIRIGDLKGIYFTTHETRLKPKEEQMTCKCTKKHIDDYVVGKDNDYIKHKSGFVRIGLLRHVRVFKSQNDKFVVRVTFKDDSEEYLVEHFDKEQEAHEFAIQLIDNLQC